MSDPGVNDAKDCPECGAKFSPTASPLGVCPACLLKLGASDPAWRPPTHEGNPSLTSVLPVPLSPSGRGVGQRSRPLRIAAAVALALLLAVAVVALLRTRNETGLTPTTVVRFGLPLPDDAESVDGAQFAVSPDGTQIVLAARGPNELPRLWIRPLRSIEWRELARTEGAALPFWSPDSRDVGFFADKKLKRIDLANGLTQVLCEAPAARGGAWSRLGLIVFAPSGAGPLQRVAASGGIPQPATALDHARSETAHAWPYFLPDGRHFLFVTSAARRPGGALAAGLHVGSLDSQERKLIVAGGGAGAFAQGFLLFARDAALMAQRFDSSRAVPIDDFQQISGADPIDRTAAGGSAYSVSSGGALVYRTGVRRRHQLTWFDRAGRVIGVAGEPGDNQHFSLSPDGRYVAVVRRDGQTDSSSIWMIDVFRSVTSRLTFGPSQHGTPLWSPDGGRVVFASRPDGVEDLYVADVNGGGKEQVIHQSAEPKRPTDWSQDGRLLLYSTESANAGSDLWVLPFEGNHPSTRPGDPAPVEGRKPYAFLQSPFNESDGRFSPDGRWVAYVSDESGRDEVYVRTFPQPDGRWQISARGGSHPRWRRDGRELFFVAAGGQLMSVDVQTDPALRTGVPRALFPIPRADAYDVSPDGQRFLVKIPFGERPRDGLQVVLNWTAELRQ